MGEKKIMANSWKSLGNIFRVVSKPHGGTTDISETDKVSSASGLFTAVAAGWILDFEFLRFAAPETETKKIGGHAGTDSTSVAPPAFTG